MGAAETRYVDAELLASFSTLLRSMTALAEHLAETAGPLEVNSERLCIFEPSRHNDMDLPKHVEDAIGEANRLGGEITKGRETFILIAEERFSVLPQE